MISHFARNAADFSRPAFSAFPQGIYGIRLPRTTPELALSRVTQLAILPAHRGLWDREGYSPDSSGVGEGITGFFNALEVQGEAEGDVLGSIAGARV